MTKLRLFHLIKSLSTDEKIHFKKFAKRHINTNEESYYLKLFEVIDNQEDYDEEAIISQMYSANDRRYFSNLKGFLYKSILRSLRNHNEGRYPLIEIEESILSTYILIEKGLYEQALHLLSKAKGKAVKHNYDLKVLEILVLERRLIRRNEWKNSKARLLAKQIESNSQLSDLITLLDLLDTYEKLFMVSKERNTREEFLIEASATYSDFLSNVKDISQYKGESLICYHSIHEIYFRLKKDYSSVYKHTLELVKVLEQNQNLINDDPERYILVLNKFILCCHKVNDIEKLEETFDKIDALTAYSKKTELLIFKSYNERLRYYLEARLYENARKLLPAISMGLDKYENHLPIFDKMIFLINIAITHLLCDNLQDAQDFNNKILNERRVPVRMDIFFLAKTLEILILFEKEEFLLLGYRLDVYGRYSSKSKAYRSFSKSFTKYLQKLSKVMDKPRRLQLLEAFREEISSPGHEVTGRESVLNWIELKIRK